MGEETSEDMERKIPVLCELPNLPDEYCENFDRKSNSTESILLKKLGDDYRKTSTVHIVEGMRGTGKTSAVISVGRHPQIQTFYDAVWFYSFAETGDISVLINGIQDIIRNLVGFEESKTFLERCSGNRNSQNAFLYAIEVLRLKRVLLIFDDISEEVDQSSPGFMTYSVIRDLVLRIRRSTGNCRVVITTTDLGIKQITGVSSVVSSQHLRFDSNIAKQILCAYAKFELSEIISSALEDKGKSFNIILEYCGGLQIALAIAGKRIRDMIEFGGVDRNCVWKEYSLDLDLSLLLTSHGPDGHRTISGIIRSSLHRISRSFSGAELASGLKVEDCFVALSVLKKQQVIPIVVLKYLWNENIRYVRLLYERFVRLNLVSLDKDLLGSEGIRIHDIIHQFCEDSSEQKQDLHARFLANLYENLTCTQEIDARCRQWWAKEKKETKQNKSWNLYLMNNVVRHLLRAGMLTEALHLLSDFRWTQARINRSQSGTSCSGLVTDIELLISGLKLRPETLEEVMKGLHSLREAVELSKSFIANNSKEIAFQMYGRLAHLQKNALVKRYIWTLETHAEKPWLRPSTNILEMAGGSIYRKTRFRTGLRTVMATPELQSVVLGGEDGFLSVLNIHTCVYQELKGHKGPITCLAVARERNCIFSAGIDGTLRCWKTDLDGLYQNELFPNPTALVRALAVTRDENFIVFGTDNGQIGMVEFTSKSLVEWKGHSHEGSIRSVCVVGKKGTILSGSQKGFVRKWCLDSKAELECNIQKTEGEIRAMAINQEETFVAVAADKCIAIYDLANEEKLVERRLQQDPLSIVFSADGKTAHFGLSDGRTGIISAPDGKMFVNVKAHSFRTWGITLTNDNAFLVSASMDGSATVQRVKEAIQNQTSLEIYEVSDLAVDIKRKSMVYGWRNVNTGLQRLRFREMEPTNSLLEYKPQTIGDQLSKSLGKVSAISFSPDGQYLCEGRESGEFFLYQIRENRVSRKSQIKSFSLSGLKISRTVISATFEGPIRSVCVSNNSELVAAASNKTLKIWRISDETEVILPNLPMPNKERTWKIIFNEEGNILIGISEFFWDQADYLTKYGTFHFWENIGQENSNIKYFSLPLLRVADIKAVPVGFDVLMKGRSIYSKCIGDNSIRVYDLHLERFSMEESGSVIVSDLENIAGNTLKELRENGKPFLEPFSSEIKCLWEGSEIILGTLEYRIGHSFRSEEWVYDEISGMFAAAGRMQKLISAHMVTPTQSSATGEFYPTLPDFFGETRGSILPSMRSHNDYSVFISFAGTERKEMAEPLYRELTSRGVSAFLDSEDVRIGTQYSERITKVMKSAKIGVFILSPYFVARRWPMKELRCFLDRKKNWTNFGDCFCGNSKSPVIIPVFYLLDVASSKSKDIFDITTTSGESLFMKEGFYRDDRQKDTSTKEAHKALCKLSSFLGIRNEEKVPRYQEGESENEGRRRMELIKRISSAVEDHCD